MFALLVPCSITDHFRFGFYEYFWSSDFSAAAVWHPKPREGRGCFLACFWAYLVENSFGMLVLHQP